MAGGDEAGDVGDVGHEEGAGFFGDFGEGVPIPDAGVGAGAGDDEFGFVFECGFFYFGHVDAFGLGIECVVHGFEPFAGDVDGFAVGKVAAVVEVEAHDGVAGHESGHEDGLVGLAAGVGLDVDVVAVEEFLGAIAGEVFDDVDELAAAVVAAAGVAFGVFVGEGRGGGGHDGGGDVVFAGDEFEGGFLAAGFVGDGLPECGVGLGVGVLGGSLALGLTTGGLGVQGLWVYGVSWMGHYTGNWGRIKECGRKIMCAEEAEEVYNPLDRWALINDR